MTRRVLRGFSAERLVHLRERAGLSRGELARLAGVSLGAVQSWETGRATPQVDTLAKAVAALGVSMGDIVLIEPDQRYLGDLRVFAGMTQPQLAAKAAMSTTALSSVELGHARLTDEVAKRLAAALENSVQEVVDAYERTRTRPPHTPA